MSQWTLARTARFLPFAVFVATFDRSVVAPMLLTMGQDFNVDLATITLSVSAYLLFYGLAQPVWGLISDRLGRISTLRLALVLAAVMDLVSIIPMSIGPFIAIRAIAGATMAGVFPTAVIFLGDTISDSRARQSSIASLQTGVALGLSLGTVLGGIGVVVVGWQAFFAATAIVCLGLALVLRRAPNPKPGAELLPIGQAFGEVARNPWAWFLYGLVFLEAAALLGGFNLVPAALEETGRSPAVAGIATGTYGLFVLLASQIVRRTTHRTSPALYLLIGGTSASLGFGLLILSVTPVTVLVSCALQGIAWVTMHTTLQTWATTLSSTARATAVSLFAGFMFLGNGAGAFIAGSLLDFRGSATLFFTVTVGTIALTVLSFVGARRYAHRLG
ncbi:MAG: MFS transporter [Candidatus Nanopelagicales bacterium]|nr:MFS transporter [Candidatus Nanopelagicales bacterium]